MLEKGNDVRPLTSVDGLLGGTEVELLIGNASKANNELGWKPKTRFEELVKIMTKADFELVKKL